MAARHLHALITFSILSICTSTVPDIPKDQTDTCDVLLQSNVSQIVKYELPTHEDRHGVSSFVASLTSIIVAATSSPDADCGNQGLRIALAVALVIFAGLMSGLTLGLLSLAQVDLAVIKRSGTEVEKTRAKAVEGLLQNKHFLLVTLILCNAFAMETVPLVLDEFMSPLAAVLVSVTGVLFFSEIIPQAICKVYGLAIGAATAPLVHLLLIVCAPLAWPIGKLLDCCLGHDNGTIYRRRQISAMIDIKREEGALSHEEASVMQRALQFRKKSCVECMTPAEDVNYLDQGAHLDESTVNWMLDIGHSRIPVRGEDSKGFIGVVLVSRLIELNGISGTPVRSLPLSPILNVTAATSCYQLLSLFQSGCFHMAAIYPEGTKMADPCPGVAALGVITPKDLVAELTMKEAVDETRSDATDTENTDTVWGISKHEPELWENQ